jgi:tetratricopeptide (TPR) repeat protein
LCDETVHSLCAIVSTSQKEVVTVKSAYMLVTALLLTPFFFASAQQAPQNPSTAAATAQKPALTVQHEANFDAERQQANQLYLAGKALDALPLYEDLCRQDQANPAFAERHGAGLLAKAQTISDPQQNQALYAGAMKELLRAESLGDNSPYVETVLGLMSKTPIGLAVGGPMGGLPLTVGYYYKGSPQAQLLIQQGEAAFSHNDLATALKFYTAAAAADPSLYTAALFAGDTCFRLKDHTNAGVWFAKAIAIDPDRETAYRYWADALMHTGDSDGARVKYEQAIAAEPYSRSTYAGLRQWAMQTHTALVGPQVRRPDLPKENGKFTDASLTTETGDGHSSWLVYAQTRLAHDPHVIFNEWIMAGATTNSPQFNFVPSGYVHTLAEEVEAINAMLADLKKKLAEGTVTEEKLEPGLKMLLQIQKEQMLEPFILLSFNDAGLRHGYPEYRAAHRDQVVAYIDRYLISHSATPAPPNPNWVPINP